MKGKLTVKSVAYDVTLGGRCFDEAIASHIADDANKKLKAEYDVRDSPRAWLRILQASEKQIKRVISAGTPRATINLDNLANDRDYSFAMTKDEFLALATPISERVTKCVSEALESANVKPTDLDSVEIVGGGMRLPCVQEALSKFLGGVALGKTINMEEGVSRGCALMCAVLSPAFRVRAMDVSDVTP